MIIFYFIFLAIILFKCRITVKGFHADYLSKSTSNAARGIFAFLIFMRHVYSYFELENVWTDTWFKAADRFLGQGIVCLFLFYTGYGIYESYKKNRNYFDSFLENRFLKTLVNFNVGVVLYWLVQVIILKKFISLSTFITALIGLSSIGNSNWYMFYIFIAYLIIFVSFRLFKKHDLIAIFATLGLTVTYIIYARESDISFWWYDTALCVPLGIIYSYFKEKIEKLLLNKNLIYYPTALAVLMLYIGSALFHLENNEPLAVIFSHLMFTLAFVLVSMKISFNNRVLTWLGKYSFAIYLVQRIPMLILQKYFLPDMNRYLFVVLTFALTLITAYLFDLLCKGVNKLLFEKPQTAIM